MSANTGRPDLDRRIAAVHIPTGEPVFLLRGHDPAAFDGVLGWALKCKALGAPLAVIEQGLRQGDAMLAWPEKRLPDAKHLSEGEAKQLAYAHGRRAWNARVEIATPEILLAEQRGWDAAMAAMRAPPALVVP